jgi:hypothetical protein
MRKTRLQAAQAVVRRRKSIPETADRQADDRAAPGRGRRRGARADRYPKEQTAERFDDRRDRWCCSKPWIHDGIVSTGTKALPA